MRLIHRAGLATPAKEYRNAPVTSCVVYSGGCPAELWPFFHHKDNVWWKRTFLPMVTIVG